MVFDILGGGLLGDKTDVVLTILSPYGPGPIWARARAPPCRGAPLAKKRSLKKNDLMKFDDFMKTKKARDKFTSKLAAESRQDLCSEAQW